VPALTFWTSANFALANFLASRSFGNVSVALMCDRFSCRGSSNETNHVPWDLLAMRSSRARSSVNDPVFLTAFVLGSGSGAWLPLVQRPHHRYARHHDDAAMIGSIEQKARGDVSAWMYTPASSSVTSLRPSGNRIGSSNWRDRSSPPLPLHSEKFGQPSRISAEAVPGRPELLHAILTVFAAAFGRFASHRDHAVDAPMPTLKLNADRADLDLIAVVLGSE